MTTYMAKNGTEFLDEARKRSREVLAIRSFAEPIRNSPLSSQQSSQFPLSETAVTSSLTPLDSSNVSSLVWLGSGKEDHRPDMESPI